MQGRSERQRYHQLIQEFKSTLKEASEQFTLFRSDSVDPGKHLDAVQDDIKPRLQRLSNELCHIILSYAKAKQRGKATELTREDMAEGQRLVNEAIGLLQQADPLR